MYDLLVIGEIDNYLNKFGCHFYDVIIFTELASTNTYILDNIAAFNDATVVVAEMQTAGRGRFANKWLSHKSLGLTFSMLKKFDLAVNIEALPLVIAIAIKRTLLQYNINVKIKWPNDICNPDGSKIAGILLESGISNQQRYVVIGIGINDSFKIKRSLFLASLLNELHDATQEFLVSGFNELLRSEWLDNCIHYHKTVGIYQNGKFVASGINIGLSDAGAIVIKTPDGEALAYSSASLRYEVD